MDAMLNRITDYLQAQSWQIGVLVVTIALISWALQHRSAHVRYLLWLVVLAKCLVPPVVNVPLPVLPEPMMQTAAAVAAPSEIESPVSARSMSAPAMPPLSPAVDWFHPLVWWANKRIRAEREKRCDEMAIAHLGAQAKEYSTAIINTLIQEQESIRPVPSLAIAGPVKNIEERIRTMMRPGRAFYKRPNLVTAATVTLIMLLSAPTALVLTARAQAEGPAETANESKDDLVKSLHQAIRAGDLAEVNRLINQGADVNMAQGEKAETPLHLAASNGHVEIVKALLAKGANVNVVDVDGNTALVSAIYSQNGEETVKALIKGGVDVNKGPQDSQPLNNAIWMSSTGMVEALLDAGAKTDVKDSAGWIPLHYAAFFDPRDNKMLEVFLNKTKQPDTIYLAAYRGDLEAVKSHISSGADVNVKDSAGFMPLHWAVLQDSTAMAEYLIAHGAEINATVGFLTPLYSANAMPVIELLVSKGAAINTNNRQNALHKACRVGDLEVATFLVNKGADVNAKASAGNTPLTYALQHGHAEVVRLLVANGADVNAKNANGQTPLGRAIRMDDKAAVELLVANGANTEASPSGLTPLDEAKRRENTEIVNILRAHGVKGTLHGAACLGDVDEVKRLIAEGADINAKSDSGWTPLHRAVYEGHESLVELLVTRGADINAQFRLGGTPLSFAAIKGQKDMVEFLLAKGADINIGTPLVGAAVNGHTAIVELLLARGADVNLKDKYNGRTALEEAKNKNHTEIVDALLRHGAKVTLHGAVSSGDLDVVKRLVSEGVPVDSSDEDGRTPLHIACRHGHGEIARFLVDKGVDVNAVDVLWGAKPLGIAAYYGHRSIVELLLSKGAEIEHRNRWGNTALSEAAHRGNANVVKLLLAGGADADGRNDYEDTPLHRAAAAGHEDMVSLLIANGADINAKRDGETALHRAMINDQKEMVRSLFEKGLPSTPLNIAAFFGELEKVKKLLAEGADINERDICGYCPLLCATCGGQQAVVDLLVAYKADVNAKDNRGFTALHAACHAGQKRTAEVLIAAGASVNTQAKNGGTPLYWASYEGHEEVVKLLIAKGAEVNSRQYRDHTPLHIACRNGHVGTVELLIREGAEVNAETEEGETPLALAKQRTRRNRAAILSLLRKSGAKE